MGFLLRVKVHPHRTYIQAGEEACVSVTPDRRHGRAYYMGTVELTNVCFRIHRSGVERARKEQIRNVHAWAVGTHLNESPLQLSLPAPLRPHMAKVTYHYNIGRFLTVEPEPVDVTDGTFKAAYFVGRDFYVSKEW